MFCINIKVIVPEAFTTVPFVAPDTEAIVPSSNTGCSSILTVVEAPEV
ncbi:MAG: hypothetical protein LBG48_00315 [Rickettsiales bacterium]|nr:hypothetical protein [Rickettsiales bacterium]